MTSTQAPRGISERAPVWLILASQFFNAAAAAGLIPAMPAIATHLGTHAGDGAFMAQMVLVAPAFSIILGSPLAGVAARLLSARSVLVGSLLLYVFAGIYGSIAPSFVPLLVSRLLLGLASSFLAALTTAEASRFNEERRSRLIGLGNAVSSVSTVLVMIACGWIASRYGWRAPFFIYLWPLPLLPVILLTGPAVAPAATKIGQATDLVPFARVLPVYLLAAIWSMMMFAPAIQGPFILAAKGMNNPAIIGILMGLSAMLSGLSATAYGWVARRVNVNSRKLLIFSCYFVSAAFITFSRQQSGVEFGIVIAGLSAGMISPLLISQLLQRLPPHRAATAIGLFMSVLYGSQLVDPFLFKLIKAFVPLPIFEVIMIICLVGGLFLLLTIARGQGRQQPETDRQVQGAVAATPKARH